MAFIPEAKIQEILAKANIVDIIRDYLPVEKDGRNFVCKCPFHDDKNPSLKINQEKQIFKCFVCGTSGNVINFVQKYNNISFQEASKSVANKVEIDLGNINEHIENVPQKILNAHKILLTVQNYAAHTLYTDVGKKQLTYLKDRNFDDKTIKSFNIGYIPSSKDLITYMIKKGFTLESLAEAGVININETSDDRAYTFMNNRITFPITDSKGNTVGFSCRTIDSSQQAKYINSPDSEIFNKGSVFYNQSNAMNAIHQHKQVILMEGQLDVTKAHQLGIENCICSMGTALTKNQTNLLKKLRVPVKICFDGDKAGIDATIKNYHALKAAGVEAFAVLLPNGMDPDDMINHHPLDFAKILNVNENILDYMLKIPIDLETFAQREEYTMNFLNELQNTNNVLAEDHYIQKLEIKTGFKADALSKKYESLKPQNNISNIKVYKSQKKTETQWKSSKSIKINVNVKTKLDFRSEVTKNYDRLLDSKEVIAFDQNNLLQRNEILKKYCDLKGSVFETTITMINYENAEYVAQSITKAIADEISKSFEIPRNNLEYLAFFHKDKKFPHIHIQLYQKEAFKENFDLSSKLIQNIKNSIATELNTLEKSIVIPASVPAIGI